MKLLFKYLRVYKLQIFITLLLACVGQLFSMMDPFIIRLIIDNYASKISKYTLSEFVRGIILLGSGIIAVAMVSRVARAFQDYFLNLITQKVSTDIYNDGMKHALTLPYAVFEDQRSGETLGILQKVRVDVQRLVSASVNILFTSIIGIVAVTIYSFTVNWVIGPIFLITIPILGAVSSLITKKIKKIQKQIVNETTALAGSTTESLRNIELIKSTGLVNQEINRLESTTNKILILEIKKVKYVRSLSFIQGTLINFLRTSIILVMMVLIYRQQLSIGEFFSLFMYTFFIFNPLSEIGNILNIYSESVISLENFQSLLKKLPEPQPLDPKLVGKIDKIAFESISYRHFENKKPALLNIDFNARKGQVLAFVGPSGAGKSTLIKLLTGLYVPSSGSIYFNEIPSDEIDKEDFRSKIGIVNQETHLFAGSIKENLLFVKPEATDEELLNVLHLSASHSILERANNGLNTHIGEGGIKISGGEKQRLAIARALLRNPSLLIFDEATSALDSLTEEEINSTIKSLPGNKDRITILVAHRLSTIMHADTIFVLEKGQIVESGNHDELLNIQGLYSAMWRQQIGKINANKELAL